MQLIKSTTQIKNRNANGLSVDSWVTPHWDFRCVLCFFQAKLRIRQQEAENAVTLKRLKVETLNLELRWSTCESFFFGGSRSCDAGF